MHVSKQTAIRVILLNCWAVLFILVLGYFGQVRQTHQFDSLFVQAGDRYGVDPRLISAMVWKESRFKVDAKGQAGEIGLMQLMPGAAGEWAKAESIIPFNPDTLYNPSTNIMAGTWYISQALQDWQKESDPLPYALAQYNAGRGRVLKWKKPSQKPPADSGKTFPSPAPENTYEIF